MQQAEASEFRGADRIRQARVSRTQEAVRRVEDWALRLAQHTIDVPDTVEALTAAKNEIEAILRDEKYRNAGGVFLSGEMTPYEREGRSRQLTIAACRIIEALTLSMLPPQPRRRKHG